MLIGGTSDSAEFMPQKFQGTNDGFIGIKDPSQFDDRQWRSLKYLTVDGGTDKFELTQCKFTKNQYVDPIRIVVFGWNAQYDLVLVLKMDTAGTPTIDIAAKIPYKSANL